MPRAGLSTDVVVREAARLADEIGGEHLTLATVASSFGVAVPSLYKHVGGVDDLRRRITVLAIRELDEALTEAAVGKSHRDALKALACAYRGYASAHPARYQATLAAPEPDDVDHRVAAQALLATVFATLSGYGLVENAAVDATRFVRASLHGFVALEAAHGFAMPQSVDRSFARLVTALDDALAHWEGTSTEARDRKPHAGDSRTRPRDRRAASDAPR